MKLKFTLLFTLLCFSFQSNLFGQCNNFTYCASSGGTPDEWIGAFEMGTIDNVSGDNNGYADFTNLSTEITVGNTYNFTCTPEYSDFEYNEVFQIWIDFNSDGDFEDADELIFASDPGNVPVSGSFTVPITAIPVVTTMRVTMSFSSAVPPCGTFTFGEVEDYCVSIVGGNGCYQSPMTIDDITDVGATANWLVVPDAESYNFRYREVGTTTWTTVNTTDNFYAMDLAGCAIYEAQVETLCPNGLTSEYGPISEFLTFGCGNCLDIVYCEPDNINTNFNWIESIELNTMNSVTGNNGGYVNLTGPTTTTLDLGNSYGITTTAGDDANGISVWYTAYIDFNADGDFNDANELVMNSQDDLNELAYSQSFLVPTDAVVGTTRMRVIIQNFGGAPADPCANFLTGEIEDYCIEIAEGNGCYQSLLNIEDITDMGAMATWDAVASAESYNLRYREVGTTMWTNVNTTDNFFAMDLEGCAIYEAELETLCPNGVSSGYGIAVQFLTFGCGNCLDLTYCEIDDPSSNISFIESVSLNGWTNVSGNNGGYADFTGPVVTSLEQGLNYNLTLTELNNGFPFNHWYTAYIDFNADGDFDDPFEKVMDSEDVTLDQTFSDFFPVPPTAVVGTTRMRVFIQNFTSVPTNPCVTFLTGEAEDYCIEITEGSGCYLPLETAIIDNLGESVLIGWEMGISAESYSIRYREIGTVSWNTFTDIPGGSNSYELTGLEECTEYEFQLRTNCPGTSTTWSSSIPFITFGCGACYDQTYCEAEAQTAIDDHIEGVIFGDLNNISGNNGGYINFEDEFGAVYFIDSTYNLELIPGWDGFMFGLAWSVYIDYNGDGDFDDINETVFTAETSTDIQTAQITIPIDDVEFGLTKMRIICREGIVGPPCESYTFGEVEDYCIRIQPSVFPCLSPLNLDTTFVGATTANLEWEMDQYELAIGYIMRYKAVADAEWMQVISTDSPNYELFDLEFCTDYEYQVTSVCPTSLSEFSESFFFSTACASNTENELDNKNVAALKVYPNPFTDRIQVDFELRQSSEVSVQLLNISGQLIQSKDLNLLGAGLHQIEMVQPDLASGMYMIRVSSEEDVVLRKVVKN